MSTSRVFFKSNCWSLSLLIDKLLPRDNNKSFSNQLRKTPQPPPIMAGHRHSITKGLERKVLAIVRRYINELSASEQINGSLRLSVSKVYQYVAADGGVPRQKKQNLERMIEKALFVIQEEEEGGGSSSDDLDSEFEGLNEEGLMEPKVGSGRDLRIGDTMD